MPDYENVLMDLHDLPHPVKQCRLRPAGVVRPDAAPNSRLFQAFHASVLLRAAKPTRAFPIPAKNAKKACYQPTAV